jgi:hypothetical protein
MNMGHWWNITDREKTEVFEEKTYLGTTTTTTCPTLSELWFNPGLRVEKLLTEPWHCSSTFLNVQFLPVCPS